MARVPAAGVMVASPKDPATLKAEEEQRRKAAAQLPGAALAPTYTIAAGEIKPTVGLFAVDTEGAAASDDLDRLLGEDDVTLAGFPQHGVVILRAANTARTVNVRNLAGGPWDVALAFGSSFALDDDRKMLALQLRGVRWYEIDRGYGADSASARAALGVTQLATLADPANPGDEGKYVGASAGNLAWTAAAPGGDGFLGSILAYPGSGANYDSGNPVRFNQVEIGDPDSTDGFIFTAPNAEVAFAQLECRVKVERANENADYDFVTLKAALIAVGFFSNKIDETGLLGARGLPSRSVFFRPNSENDRLRDPYLAVSSLVLPLLGSARSVRLQVNGVAGGRYRVLGNRARSWLSVQWM